MTSFLVRALRVSSVFIRAESGFADLIRVNIFQYIAHSVYTPYLASYHATYIAFLIALGFSCGLCICMCVEALSAS